MIFLFQQQIQYMIFSCQEYFMQFIQYLRIKVFFSIHHTDGSPRWRKQQLKQSNLQVFKMMIRNFIINIEINKASGQMLLFLFFFYLQLIRCQPQNEDCKQYKIMKACQYCPRDMHQYSGNCIYNLPNCISHSLQNPFLCAVCSPGYFLNHDHHCEEQKKQSEEYPIFPSTKYTQMNFDDNFTVYLFRKIEEVMEQTANGQFYQVNTIFFYQSIISQGERYMRLTSQEQLGCLDQIYKLQISNHNLQHQELIYQYHLIVDQSIYQIIDENDSNMGLLHRYKQSNPPEFRDNFIVAIYKSESQQQFIFILFNPNAKVIQVKKTKFQMNFYIAQFAPENQKTLANSLVISEINEEDKYSIYNMIITTKSWEYLKNFTINSFKKYLVFSKDEQLNQIKVYYYSVTLTIFQKGTYTNVPVKFKKILQVNKDGGLRNYGIRYLGDELPTTKLSLTLYCERANYFSLNKSLQKFQFQKNSTEIMNASIYTSILQLVGCSCLDNLFNQTSFSLRELLVSYTNNREYYYISYNKLEIYPYGPYVKHFVIEYDKQFGLMKLYSQYETVSLKVLNTLPQFHQSMEINLQQNDKKDKSRALSQLFTEKAKFLKKMRQDTLYSRNSRIKSFSNLSMIQKRQNGSIIEVQYVQIQLMYLPTPGVKQNQFPVYKNVTFRYANFNSFISHMGYFVTRNDNYTQIPLLENELNQQKPNHRYRVCIGALIQIIKNKNITKNIGQWFLVRYYLINNSKNRFLMVTKFIFPIGFEKYVYFEIQVSRKDNKSSIILSNDTTQIDKNSINDKNNQDKKKINEQNLQYQIRQTEAGQVEDGIFGGLNIFSIRKIHEYYYPPGKQNFIPTEQDLQNAIQGADKKIYVSYPISKDYTTINLIDQLNTSCQDEVNHIYFNNTSYSVSRVPMEIVFSDPRFIRMRQAIQLVYKNLSSYYLFYLRRTPTVTLVLKNNTNTFDKVFNPLLLQFQMVYINFTQQNKFVGLRIMAGYKWKSGEIIFSQFSQITIQQSTFIEMYQANQQQIIQSNSTYPRNIRSNYHVQKLYQENRKKLYFNGQYGIQAELINSYECNEKYKDIVKLFEAISKASIFSKQVTSICVNYPYLTIYHNSYSYNFSIIDNLPLVKVIPKPSFLSTTQSVKNLMRQTVAEYLCIDPQHIGRFNIGSKSSVMGIYDIVTVQFTIKTEEKWEIFRQKIIERFTFEVISQKNKYLNLKQLPLLKVKQREIRSYGICQQISLNLTKKILQEPYLIPIQYTSFKFNQKQQLVDVPVKSDLAQKIYQKNLTDRCKKYLFYGNFPTFQNTKLQKELEEMNKKQQKNNTEKTKYFLSQRESEVTQLFLKGNMITKIIFTNEGFYAQGENYRNLSFPGIKQYIHPYLNQILNLYLDKSSKKTQQSQINLVFWKWKQYSQHYFLIQLFYDTPSNYIIRIRVIARKPRKSETEIIYPVIEKLIVTQLEFIKKNVNLNLLQQEKAQDIQNVIKQIKSWKQFQIAQASLKSRYGMYFDSKSKIMNIKSIQKENQLYFDVQYKTMSGFFDAYLGYSRNNNSGRVIFFNVGKNQTFYNQTKNCKQYDSSNKCKKCDDRYFLYQDKCYPDFQGCLKQVSGICVYCRPEYKITSSYRCQ